jgi:hypothetical protein
MRAAVIAILGILASPSISGAAPEMLTADQAVLCLSQENAAVARDPSVAKSQAVLRAMGCLRVGAGIRVEVLATNEDETWQVRFFPAGISRGVVLWAHASSFAKTRVAKATLHKAERSTP